MTQFNKAENLIKFLNTAGYEAFQVGGCVRDKIMGREIHDIDITTSALPLETEKVLKDNNIKFFETGLKHGTITAVFEGENFEITTYRTDGKYLDSRHPENVKFVRNIKEDLSRRDFTMNAIAFNQGEGYIDLFNGQEDIKNEVIRAVGEPNKRFQEDALRILRAIRFSSVLGFEIEENTKKAIFENKELLKNISNERIFDELKKTLLGNNVFSVLCEYREVLAVIIPEIKPTFDFEQHTKWHIYDVYTHTAKAVEVIEKDEELKLIMLFHDLGKPFAKTTDEFGTDHFKGHQKISADIAGPILKRLKVSNETYDRVMKIIPIHDIHISHDKKNIKKWLNKLGEQSLRDLLMVKIADKKAQNPEMVKDEIPRIKFLQRELDEIINSHQPYSIKDLKINGHDLISLGFRGEIIGQILSNLVDKLIDEEIENEKEVLLEYVRRNY